MIFLVKNSLEKSFARGTSDCNAYLVGVKNWKLVVALMISMVNNVSGTHYIHFITSLTKTNRFS